MAVLAAIALAGDAHTADAGRDHTDPQLVNKSPATRCAVYQLRRLFFAGSAASGERLFCSFRGPNLVVLKAKPGSFGGFVMDPVRLRRVRHADASYRRRLRARVRRLMGKLARCHDRLLGDSFAGMGGTITLRLTITPAGSARDVTSNGFDYSVARCFAKVVRLARTWPRRATPSHTELVFQVGPQPSPPGPGTRGHRR